MKISPSKSKVVVGQNFTDVATEILTGCDMLAASFQVRLDTITLQYSIAVK
jgi:hypothetical protein